MNVDQRVRQFIIENFYVSDAAALTNDASLVSGGYVDSTGMLEVIGFLETEFSMDIAEEDLVPENFETIDRIASYVTRKRNTTR
jgi:acyl carrier protein